MQERANPLLKSLDYYLGIPLVWLLSLFKKRRSIAIPENPLWIGCMKTSAIGDTVLVSAVLRDLKVRFPQAKIILFTGGSNFQAAQIFAGVDQVVRLPMSNPLAALRILRQFPLDIMFDFDSWPRINAVLSFFSRAQLRLGFRTPGQHRHSADHKVVAHQGDIHEIENYRHLAALVGAYAASVPDIRPAAPGVAGFETTVIFHCWPGGSRALEKMWTNASWVELGRRVKARGYRVLLSTGPGDVQKSEELLALAPDLFELLRTPGLRELISALRSCRAVVSVDTGVAHLAGALGQKTLVLYGPTSPERWGALGAGVLCLKDQAPTSISLGFEKNEGRKGLEFSVDDVEQRLGPWL